MNPYPMKTPALTATVLLLASLPIGCSRQPSAAEGVTQMEKSLGKAMENPAVQLAIAAAKTNDLGVGVVALQEAKRSPGLSAEQLQSVEQTSQAIIAELLQRAADGDARAKADLQLIEQSRSQ